MNLRLFFVLTIVSLSYAKLINPSCKLITQFVDGHNARRLLLAKGQVPGQPAAREMNYVVWDDELAAKASKWASKNKFLHNPDKTIGSGRFRTGENLYWYGTTDSTFKLEPDVALNSWFGEYKDYTYEALKPVSIGKKTGHYTQMVWSNTTYIGCAVSQYKEKSFNNFLVVCDYGPAGNYIGQYPYNAGNPSGALVCGTEDTGCGQFYGSC